MFRINRPFYTSSFISGSLFGVGATVLAGGLAMGALYGIYKIGKSAIEGASQGAREGSHRAMASLADRAILWVEATAVSQLNRVFGTPGLAGAQPPAEPVPTPFDHIGGMARGAASRLCLHLIGTYSAKLGIANPEPIMAALQRAQARSMSNEELEAMLRICAESGIEISEQALHNLINYCFPNRDPAEARATVNALIIVLRQPGIAPGPADGRGPARVEPEGLRDLLRASIGRLSRSIEGSLQGEGDRVVAAAGRNVERVLETTRYAVENLIFVLVILSWHHIGIL